MQKNTHCMVHLRKFPLLGDKKVMIVNDYCLALWGEGEEQNERTI